jgi:hypothetical protein
MSRRWQLLPIGHSTNALQNFVRTKKLESELRTGPVNHHVLGIRLKLEKNQIPNLKLPQTATNLP